MELFSPFNLSLVAFLVCFSLQASAKSSCPRGWVKREKQCFGFFNIPLAWQDAELACQDFGATGHLASIHNEDDMKVLSENLHHKYKGGDQIWIGLFDPQTGSEKNRQFKWIDGTKGNYYPWAPGNPDNWRGIEHCVELVYTEDYTKWNDEECIKTHPYLCKYTI